MHNDTINTTQSARSEALPEASAMHGNPDFCAEVTEAVGMFQGLAELQMRLARRVENSR
jgi:hypothetical protein